MMELVEHEATRIDNFILREMSIFQVGIAPYPANGSTTFSTCFADIPAPGIGNLIANGEVKIRWIGNSADGSKILLTFKGFNRAYS